MDDFNWLERQDTIASELSAFGSLKNMATTGCEAIIILFRIVVRHGVHYCCEIEYFMAHS